MCEIFPCLISRLLASLRTHADSMPHQRILLSLKMRLDILWWHTYIRTFNSVNFIINPSIVLFSYKGDDCLTGGGGYHGREYWSRLLPYSVPSSAIHLKENWVLLLSIKLWGHLWSGSAVELFVDNTAVCLTCTNQKPSDPLM